MEDQILPLQSHFFHRDLDYRLSEQSHHHADLNYLFEVELPEEIY